MLIRLIYADTFCARSHLVNDFLGIFVIRIFVSQDNFLTVFSGNPSQDWSLPFVPASPARTQNANQFGIPRKRLIHFLESVGGKSVINKNREGIGDYLLQPAGQPLNLSQSSLADV